MPTKADCENGTHTLDNQGLCHWCGELLDPHLWEAYIGPQKRPASVRQIEAQTKFVKRELDQADRRTAKDKQQRKLA